MGFSGDNIYNFNFNESQEGVDEKPSKERLLDVISNWAADKMNDLPGPLYLICLARYILLWSGMDRRRDFQSFLT